MTFRTGFLLGLLASGLAAQGQAFINLNFESATIVTDPSQGSPFVASNAIPGWTAYLSGISQSDIIYNTRPLDAAEVTLQGIGSDSLTPIQGNFTIELFGSSAFVLQQQSAAIGQTAKIPLTALSVIFWGQAGLNDVSFGGQTLALNQIGSTANYNIYDADISSFAGQTGQLLFTAPPQHLDIIDNIQFSTAAAPEPGTLALGTLGGLLLAWGGWRKRSPA